MILLSCLLEPVYLLKCYLHTNLCLQYKDQRGNRMEIWQSSNWYIGSLGQMTHGPSVWRFKYIFFRNFLQTSLKNCFNSLSYFFIIWNTNKEFWVPSVYKKLWKKIMLGASDTWSMSHLSQRPSKPEYYIKDCWILAHLIFLQHRLYITEKFVKVNNFEHDCVKLKM